MTVSHASTPTSDQFPIIDFRQFFDRKHRASVVTAIDKASRESGFFLSLIMA